MNNSKETIEKEIKDVMAKLEKDLIPYILIRLEIARQQGFEEGLKKGYEKGRSKAI